MLCFKQFPAAIVTFSLASGSIAAVLAGLVAAIPQARANTGFCLADDASVMITAQTLNDVQVTIARVRKPDSDKSGRIVLVARNNQTPDDSGSNSLDVAPDALAAYPALGPGPALAPGSNEPLQLSIPGTTSLAGGHCYNVAIMTRTGGSAGADTPMTCDTTLASQMTSEIAIIGFLLTDTSLVPQATLDLLGLPVKFEAGPPVMNCP